MNSKTNHLLLPFSTFGVSLLGLVLLNNEPRRVTPPYIKESREDSIKRVKRYKEELRRDSIFFAKVDSIKLLRDSLRNQRIYTYILKTTITPENVIVTARKSGYQQVTLDTHYTKPQLYYLVFTSTKQMSIEEASAYADRNPDKVTKLSQQQYDQRFGNQSSEYDFYLDNLDSYYDDPENLDENPDEIFDLVLSKILCKWKQDSVVSLFLYLDSVFKYKHKLVHNQSPV